MESGLSTDILKVAHGQLDSLLLACHLQPDTMTYAVLTVLVFAVPISILVMLILRRYRPETSQKISSKMMAVKDFVAPGEGPRFRKRDRLVFMGRRVFRNAKAVGTLIRGGQGKKRKAMARLVRKVFQRGSPDGQSQSLMPDLPDEFYREEDLSESSRAEEEIPRALFLVLKSLRVFGHVDFSLFVELMKDIKYVTLRPNEYLFKIGEPDENMYIVDSGKVNVFRTSDDLSGKSSTCLLKQVGQGEAIFSLLSFIEHMGGLHKKYKTVSAKAVEESRVVIVSFNSFKKAFEAHPDHLTKVVQVVMVRLQRVTFLALHQYLGLGAELLTSFRGFMPGQLSSRKTSGQESLGESSKMKIGSRQSGDPGVLSTSAPTESSFRHEPLSRGVGEHSDEVVETSKVVSRQASGSAELEAESSKDYSKAAFMRQVSDTGGIMLAGSVLKKFQATRYQC